MNKFEKNTVSIECVVKREGMNAIRNIINNETHCTGISYLDDRAFIKIAGGRERVNRHGKMTKRIKRNLKRDHDITLPVHLVERIGNIMDQNSLNAREYIVEYTTDFQGTVGKFGDSGSCFQQGDQFHSNLLAMERNAGQLPGEFSAFRVYKASGSNLGRAWVYYAEDGAAVMFNGYGIPLDKIAILASKLDDTEPRRVRLGGDICINDLYCEAVGGKETEYSFYIS